MQQNTSFWIRSQGIFAILCTMFSEKTDHRQKPKRRSYRKKKEKIFFTNNAGSVGYDFNTDDRNGKSDTIRDRQGGAN